MREVEVPVTFRPQGRTVYVLKGTRLVEAAAGADIVLDMPCGGEGMCGKCRVVVPEGAGEPSSAERRFFSEEELRAGVRLACQAVISGPTTVSIPQTSLLASAHKILARSVGAVQSSDDPPVTKRYVELPPPARGDDVPDVERLERALGSPLELDIRLLRDMPQRLRRLKFRGTAVSAGRRLIDFEPDNSEAENYAVAVDLGTTTLVAVLVDYTGGPDLAVASRLNPQTRFGDDVLSRILHAGTTPGGLDQLHEAAASAIDEMIGELVQQADVPRERIYEVVVSGNTTMQQLLCRVDPGPLGEVPFVPCRARAVVLPAAEFGLRVHPRATARTLPVIGGFVGGDTVAGILATGMLDALRPTLLVDIGTNGEIVLAAGGKLWAASTAAGPAFEGARIAHGMRGSIGAIEKVVVDGRLRINVIGNVPPVGLCGSGLIDAAAELLRHGLITPEGRLRTPDQLPNGVPSDLAQRLVRHDGQVSFVLAPESESGHGRAIVLTQRDFRELQLATGAIRAGIAILLRRAGLEPEELDSILVAGGFGNFVRRRNAQRIGLLPERVEHRRVRYQGNTSLAGARLLATSRKARELAEQAACRTEHVDLSRDPQFHTAFAGAMIFPE